MKTVNKPVRTGGKIVAHIDIGLPETYEELISTVAPAEILDYYVKQKLIVELGKERIKHQPLRMGKGRRMDIAYNLLTEEEALSCVGNMDKLKELLNSDDVQKRVDQYLEEQGETA